MTRTIFEIIFLIEILYLAFHYYKLFKNVVKIRRETKISIGHNNKKLERAVRAHGNFCETSPLIIILNFILYFNNLLFFAVLSLLFLAIGRTIHSFAVSDINEDINDRRKGMKFTIYSLFTAIIGIIFYIIKLIYYLFQANINTTHFLPQFFCYIENAYVFFLYSLFINKIMAERMGFEPTIDVATYNGLANRRLQPLGHLSIFLFF